MIFKETRRLLQKVFILGTLVACLGLLSAGMETKASTDLNPNLLPCCSFCDNHPDHQLCQHGCLFGCRASQ